MATWEREAYAVPGAIMHWPHRLRVTRPLFTTPTATYIYDDDNIDEIMTVDGNTVMLVIACFPNDKNRGAIVLVPNRGLWWWFWP